MKGRPPKRQREGFLSIPTGLVAEGVDRLEKCVTGEAPVRVASTGWHGRRWQPPAPGPLRLQNLLPDTGGAWSGNEPRAAFLPPPRSTTLTSRSMWLPDRLWVVKKAECLHLPRQKDSKAPSPSGKGPRGRLCSHGRMGAQAWVPNGSPFGRPGQVTNFKCPVSPFVK